MDRTKVTALELFARGSSRAATWYLATPVHDIYQIDRSFWACKGFFVQAIGLLRVNRTVLVHCETGEGHTTVIQSNTESARRVDILSSEGNEWSTTRSVERRELPGGSETEPSRH